MGNPRSLPLLVAASVVVLEAVLVGVLGVIAGVGDIRGQASDTAAAGFLAGCGVLVAVGLVLVSRGLLRRRRWARAPALLAQIIAIPVAVALGQSGQYAMGVPLGSLAIAAGVAVLAPSTTQALVGTAGNQPSDREAPPPG